MDINTLIKVGNQVVLSLREGGQTATRGDVIFVGDVQVGGHVIPGIVSKDSDGDTNFTPFSAITNVCIVKE